jgi:hypothetical protein
MLDSSYKTEEVSWLQLQTAEYQQGADHTHIFPATTLSHKSKNI